MVHLCRYCFCVFYSYFYFEGLFQIAELNWRRSIDATARLNKNFNLHFWKKYYVLQFFRVPNKTKLPHYSRKCRVAETRQLATKDWLCCASGLRVNLLQLVAGGGRIVLGLLEQVLRPAVPCLREKEALCQNYHL